MLIQGEGLDALILAYLASEDGEKISLSSDPELMGGHFKGFKHEENWLDFGMVVLEPGSRELSPKSIHEFRMQTGKDLLPFLQDAFEFFQDRISPLTDITILTRLRDSSYIEDYFISDSLNVLTTLPNELKSRIISEVDINLERLTNSPLEHPVSKYKSKYFEETSVLQVLHQTIGTTLTKELFSDFVKTLLSSNQEVLKACNHRRAWVPLYWPETLRSMLTDPKAQHMDRPSFVVPNSSTVAELLVKMKTQITSSVNFRRQPELDTSDNNLSSISFKQQVYSGNGETDLPIRIFAKIYVIHFCIEDASDLVVFWQEPKNGCYRFTIRNLISGSVIALEFGSPREIDTDELLIHGREIVLNLGHTLRCSGFAREARIPLSSSIQRENGSINLLNFHNRGFKLEYIYPSSSNSFNDNLVRAFHAYSYWRENHG